MAYLQLSAAITFETAATTLLKITDKSTRPIPILAVIIFLCYLTLIAVGDTASNECRHRIGHMARSGNYCRNTGRLDLL